MNKLKKRTLRKVKARKERTRRDGWTVYNVAPSNGFKCVIMQPDGKTTEIFSSGGALTADDVNALDFGLRDGWDDTIEEKE